MSPHRFQYQMDLIEQFNVDATTVMNYLCYDMEHNLTFVFDGATEEGLMYKNAIGKRNQFGNGMKAEGDDFCKGLSVCFE